MDSMRSRIAYVACYLLLLPPAPLLRSNLHACSIANREEKYRVEHFAMRSRSQDEGYEHDNDG